MPTFVNTIERAYNGFMAGSEEVRERQAATAGKEEIESFLHDPSARVVLSLLGNRNITEEDVLVITSRKNLSAEVLETVAKDKRWSESYPVRLALAKNPKTPLFAALSLVRYLRIFDQVEVTRNTTLPVIFRNKVESIIMEKIPPMALGAKKSLAKIASGNVLLKLVLDGYPEVVALCLNNPHLIESHLYKVISREQTGPSAIRIIADHPNWSSRYHIRYALIRNRHTPLSRSVIYLSGMKTQDLKELILDPSLPAGIRPCIHRELLERGEDSEKILLAGEQEEQVFEFEESEAEAIEREMEQLDAGQDAGSSEETQ